MFVRVPEPKSAKNRIHLDVAPSDPESEVAWLVDLGATRVRDTASTEHLDPSSSALGGTG